MTATRFSAEFDPDFRGVVILDPDESHHLKYVLRKRSGDTIELMNGQGGCAEAVIVTLKANRVHVNITSGHQVPKTGSELHLAFSLPHHDETTQMIIRSATELGVGHFHPVYSRFSRSSRLDLSESRRPRWLKTARNTCKQCGQYYLPGFDQPVPVSEFISSGWMDTVIWFAGIEPAVACNTEPMKTEELPAGLGIGWINGPEGGWDRQEIEMFKNKHVTPVTLGFQTLTSFTSAVSGVVFLLLSRSASSIRSRSEIE